MIKYFAVISKKFRSVTEKKQMPAEGVACHNFGRGQIFWL